MHKPKNLRGIKEAFVNHTDWLGHVRMISVRKTKSYDTNRFISLIDGYNKAHEGSFTQELG